MIDETWTLFAKRLAESVARSVETRVATTVERSFKGHIKFVYTESEAAKFLCVSRDTLAAWRRSGRITYTQYPQAKSDKLSEIYTYDLADLKAFRDRYRVVGASAIADYQGSVSLRVVGKKAGAK